MPFHTPSQSPLMAASTVPTTAWITPMDEVTRASTMGHTSSITAWMAAMAVSTIDWMYGHAVTMASRTTGITASTIVWMAVRAVMTTDWMRGHAVRNAPWIAAMAPTMISCSVGHTASIICCTAAMASTMTCWMVGIASTMRPTTREMIGASLPTTCMTTVLRMVASCWMMGTAEVTIVETSCASTSTMASIGGASMDAVFMTVRNSIATVGSRPTMAWNAGASDLPMDAAMEAIWFRKPSFVASIATKPAASSATTATIPSMGTCRPATATLAPLKAPATLPKEPTSVPTGVESLPSVPNSPPSAPPTMGICDTSAPMLPTESSAIAAAASLAPAERFLKPPSPSPSILDLRPSSRLMNLSTLPPATTRKEPVLFPSSSSSGVMPRNAAKESPSGPSAALHALMTSLIFEKVGVSAPIIGDVNSRPVRESAARMFAMAPLNVSLAPCAAVPKASYMASENVLKSTLPFDTSSRTSACVTPSLSARACVALMPCSENCISSSPCSFPCAATLAMMVAMSSMLPPEIVAMPAALCSDLVISSPAATPDVPSMVADVAAASRPNLVPSTDFWALAMMEVTSRPICFSL